MKNFERIFLILIIFTLQLFILYIFKVMPTTSLQLYQQVRFADRYEEVEELFIDEYKSKYSQKDHEALQEIFSKGLANSISQHTIFRYEDEWILLDTAPGTFQNRLLNIKMVEGEQLEVLKTIFGE